MDEKQITILWGYKQKEEDIFYQRSNFFLVAEAMLFTAWATLAAASTRLVVQELTISTLGFVLGIVWIYVSGRQVDVISQISSEASQVIGIYKKIRNERHAAPFSSTKLLAYFVPTAVMTAWIVLSISRVCVR
jgi:hypothetical protein